MSDGRTRYSPSSDRCRWRVCLDMGTPLILNRWLGRIVQCRVWLSRSSLASLWTRSLMGYFTFTESLARSWSLRWSLARMRYLSGSEREASIHARAFTERIQLRPQPNHALQRTRRARRGCNPTPSWAG